MSINTSVHGVHVFLMLNRGVRNDTNFDCKRVVFFHILKVLMDKVCTISDIALDKFEGHDQVQS